ncbi:dTDP-glucose 4,6-dehydratase [Aliterella atlantica CENA595]|uniref:dTDP-glucose 4,6-dehydratase n=1 Tax=Aliterella atlantica CENA595 TaxID=1618023 RepID=A0A0D8ZVG8_9CYAN|nr:dTDP-glucose 4,6-dehydratase [Aliterella atlantica CENA595]
MLSSPRRLLVTGGAGFIGANFVRYWCDRYQCDRIVVLDALTYAGNLQNLAGLEGKNNFRFVRGNICDRALIDNLLVTENIDTIAHFAAESHVDRSIVEPNTFIQTNLVGTFTLLEAFRQYLENVKVTNRALFLHISTDEVYGSLNQSEPAFTETTAYNPSSPYSASKAGSDHLVKSYYRTYNLPVIVTNCSNNYGAFQFPEKLIPLICINILLGKNLPIYGDGQNIRDWLYVEDHCTALDAVINRGKIGETYNIGGNNQVRNLDLVNILCNLMDELAPNLPVSPSHNLITFVKDRLGHDRRYAINTKKIYNHLGWTPITSLEEGLRLTVAWYLHHADWWRSLLSK